jgi:hypothetical protein
VDAPDDADFSEITIRPDGRVYVFGLTEPLLDILGGVPTREDCWRTLAAQVRTETAPADGAGDES